MGATRGWATDIVLKCGNYFSKSKEAFVYIKAFWKPFSGSRSPFRTFSACQVHEFDLAVQTGFDFFRGLQLLLKDGYGDDLKRWAAAGIQYSHSYSSHQSSFIENIQQCLLDI